MHPLDMPLMFQDPVWKCDRCGGRCGETTSDNVGNDTWCTSCVGSYSQYCAECDSLQHEEYFLELNGKQTCKDCVTTYWCKRGGVPHYHPHELCLGREEY